MARLLPKEPHVPRIEPGAREWSALFETPESKRPRSFQQPGRGRMIGPPCFSAGTSVRTLPFLSTLLLSNGRPLYWRPTFFLHRLDSCISHEFPLFFPFLSRCAVSFLCSAIHFVILIASTLHFTLPPSLQRRLGLVLGFPVLAFSTNTLLSATGLAFRLLIPFLFSCS